MKTEDKLGSLLLMLLTLAMLSGCGPHIDEELKQKIIQLTFDVEIRKSDGEYHIATAKSDFAGDSERIAESKRRYSRARSQVNSHIDYMKRQLAENMKLDPSNARKVETATNSFADYVMSGGNPNAKPQSADIWVNLALAVADRISQLFAQFNDEQRKQLQELLSDLDGGKWDEWQNVSE